jgi:hypothetical protein
VATTGEVDTYSFQTPSVTTRDASVTLRNMISIIPMMKGAVKKVYLLHLGPAERNVMQRTNDKTKGAYKRVCGLQVVLEKHQMPAISRE